MGRGDGCDLRGARLGVTAGRRTAEGHGRRCCEVRPGDDGGLPTSSGALERGHRGDRRGCHERVGGGLCPRAVEACHLHGDCSGRVAGVLQVIFVDDVTLNVVVQAAVPNLAAVAVVSWSP